MKRQGFKKFYFLILLFLCVFSLMFVTSCGEDTPEANECVEHIDVNGDEKCDKCNDLVDSNSETPEEPDDLPSENEPSKPDDSDEQDVPTQDAPNDSNGKEDKNEQDSDASVDTPDLPTDESTVPKDPEDAPLPDESETPDEPEIPNEPEMPDNSEKPIEPDNSPTVPDLLPDTNNPPLYPDNISGGETSGFVVDELAKAAATGLKSAVSIYCAFSSTYYYPWSSTPTTESYMYTGSGVIYDLADDGSAFIITNYHVIYDGDSDTENNISDDISVFLYGMENEKYAIPATFVGGSANYDIAVLFVEESEVLKSAAARGTVQAVKFANSDLVYPGQTTLAIGNPSTDAVSGISVTKGIVSVDSEYIEMTASDNSGIVSFRVIRTDTAINSGNSGGGLFNSKGELVGIVNAKTVVSNIDNIGYSLPSNLVGKVVGNIIDNCYGKECEKVLRPIIGITTGITELSTYYDENSGAIIRVETLIVSEVREGGLAEGILMAGDIIKSVSIGDISQNITRGYQLSEFMLSARIGATVSITVIRGETECTVEITITEDSIIEY